MRNGYFQQQKQFIATTPTIKYLSVLIQNELKRQLPVNILGDKTLMVSDSIIEEALSDAVQKRPDADANVITNMVLRSICPQVCADILSCANFTTMNPRLADSNNGLYKTSGIKLRESGRSNASHGFGVGRA